MKENITAEIISIGTEILLGEITDTNSVFIARQLRELGINVYYMVSVGDNHTRIADVIRTALSRAQVVITCGGLGPTVDDMTRQAVAAATDRELEFRQELLDQIAARFERFRVKMTDNNRQQAYLPAGALAIENPVGTAPSFAVEHQGGVVISLPGVPREMKFLMQEKVLPYLQGKYELGIIRARVLRTAGIGESLLDEMIGRELLAMSNPTVGLAAHSGQVDVRITAKADTRDQANEMIATIEAQLQAKIGRYVYGYDDEVLEDVLIRQLVAQGQQLVICEAGIDGAVISSLAKRNQTVLAAMQSYPTPDDLRQVYPLTATDIQALAVGTAERLKAEFQDKPVIVIVAQPEVDEGEDTSEASAVTVIVGDEVRTRTYGFGGQNSLARRWMTTWSISTVWRLLHEQQETQE